MSFLCIFTSGTSSVLGDHARPSFLPNIFGVAERERAPTKPEKQSFPSWDFAPPSEGHLLGLLHGFQGETEVMPLCPVLLGPTDNSQGSSAGTKLGQMPPPFTDQETKSHSSAGSGQVPELRQN